MRTISVTDSDIDRVFLLREFLGCRAMRILALNAGSRSHKAQLFEFDGNPTLEPPHTATEAADESAAGSFAKLLERFRGEPPGAVAHRFVHTGPELAEKIAFRVDAATRVLIERSDLAPAHNPIPTSCAKGSPR